MIDFLNKFHLCFRRLSAIMTKEFSQMTRDPATIGMMIGTPLIQLILFGYAINMTPTNLPTVVIDNDQSIYSREYIAAAAASNYFKIMPNTYTDQEADDQLTRGKIQFILNIPRGFSRDLVRGRPPVVLVDSDATDPVASSSAITALEHISSNLYSPLKNGVVALKKNKPGSLLLVHAHYNPLALTRWNIIPGLIGVILTMTLVMVTSMALAKEYESGTHEFILATPATPLEIILGKMTPYLLVGYIQILIIIVVGFILMGVPIRGSIFALLIASFPYIVANLSMGLLISTVARTQIQASVCSVFFFLPSLMLSGFFFPFRGMPQWAQLIGDLLPLSHYLVIVRGIMLKGATLMQVMPSVLSIFMFSVIALSLAITRYRGTLD
ncbi:MAG: ABC transporter permease [Legionellales bacterium]|nr:ABC transporter permease [Legionellales bacterium]